MAVAILMATPVRAAPGEVSDVEPIAFTYEAPKACPSESEFIATVQSYTRRWAPLPAGEKTARTVRVRLSTRAKETVGTFVLENAEGAVLKREIVGPTCADASEALAIMVAVAIDPGASEDGAGAAVAPHRAEPTAAEPPRSEAPRAEPTAPPRSPAAETPPNVEANVSFDLRLETTTAVIDGALFGFGASMKVALSFPAGRPWMRAWRPSFGVGLRQSLPVERDLQRGSADLLWTAGNVRLCPHQVELVTVVEAALCAEANLGAFRASVEGVPEARRATTAWVDVGGSAWAAVRISKRFFFSSTVLVSVPLWGHEFVLESGAPVAHVPPLGVLVGLGLGTRI